MNQKEGEPGAVGVASTRLVDLVESFVGAAQSRGLSRGSQHSLRVALRDVLRHLARGRVLDVHQVREGHLVAWALSLRAPRPSPRRGHGAITYQPATIAGRIQTARQFFAWLVDQDVLLVSPARTLSTRGLCLDPVGRLQIPTRAQMRDLFTKIPRTTFIQVRDWTIAELAYSSGLRIGEVCALDVADIDLDDQVVRVRQGKWRKDRVVPIGKPACTALRQWLDDARPELVASPAEQALFVKATGSRERLRRTTFGARLRTIRRLIGLNRMRVHDLRHAAALHLLQGGADLRHVQEFLGHSSLKATQVYTRLSPDEVKAAHHKAHPRERHRDLT